MQKSPVFRAFTGTALAFGLVVAAAPYAVAAPAETTSSGTATTAAATQSSALERDLGLSKAEIAELQLAEAEASTLEAELRETLGDDFGGAVFDAETLNLAVKVTDASAVPAVEAAGATAEVVTYGESTLDAIVEDLNDTGAAPSVTGWYVDSADDSVVVTVLEGQTATAEALIADASVNEKAVRIEETTQVPETFADIIGGNAYYIGSGRCSIGFSVVGGFVTAGHCGSAGQSTTYGTIQGSIFPNRDMGWVRTPSHTPRPWVNRYNGTNITVTGSTEAAIGASVCRSGSTTGWRCGTIQAKNQTVNYAQGPVYYMTRTSACAQPGDSGGSWLSGTQAQGVTSGGSGNCTIGGTTFFQPINPILSQYGLSLLT
ncbi:S1 family peptidase [Nocardiopsis ansamitocini]|uniref:Serine protease n=1 Tax=Nocardiopsis ansamitocini TaxID=1670832 RepID=A0A9W6P492_9ACTN|nr:S1 family peptidase [Nocardiopsis ansamitocini]GLU46806.1 serine protease [Nocardiopsis ansamitocini]